MRHVFHILTLTLLTSAFLALHADAADPLHDFAWCKANMVCLQPDFPVMGMYMDSAYGYACWCSGSEGTCSGLSGQGFCYTANANANCALPFWGETYAANAGYQYGMCVTCNTGYQLSDDPNPSYGCWACSATVPNCAHCSSEGVCDTCNSQYTLASSGKTCYACSIIGCTGCTTDNVCGTCSSGYTISSDKKSCYSCGITSCSGCTANGICGSCDSGYTLSPDKSACYSCGITGCNGCTANGICGSCDSGYTLSLDKSACYSCGIRGCSSCSADGECGACDPGHTLSSDKKACYSCGITGCTACTADGICGTCEPDHTLSTDGKSCIPCAIEACLSCSSSGVCAVCASGYKLSGTSGTCKKSGIPWWVWLIVGLVVAATVVVVIIVVCCCCCKSRPTPLHAEEERLPIERCQCASLHSPGESCDSGDAGGSGDLVASAWQPTQLARRRSRVVNFGGEIVLGDASPDSYQQPSFHRGDSGVDNPYAKMASDEWTFDEMQPLNLDQNGQARNANPLDEPSGVPSVSSTLNNRRRGQRRGLGVDVADVDMSEHIAGSVGITDILDDDQLSARRQREGSFADIDL